jgi:hypothetical protein
MCIRLVKLKLNTSQSRKHVDCYSGFKIHVSYHVFKILEDDFKSMFHLFVRPCNQSLRQQVMSNIQGRIF